MRLIVFAIVAMTVALLAAPGAAAEISSAGAPGARPETPDGFRKLAPGVMLDVDPERKREEDTSIHDLVELLAVDPAFGWAKAIYFQHQIWSLEFSYKPVRFIAVDVPGPDGKLVHKTLWYLVYKVRNPGTKAVFFSPRFLLESKDAGKVYPDLLSPLAVPQIRLREDARRPLLNSIEMARPIPPSADGVDRSIWGVAIWQDVDPRTDRFTISIGGLTNAYRWTDHPDGRRTVERKTLLLNFWRPSDPFHEHEEEISLGGPGDVDYRWVYR